MGKKRKRHRKVGNGLPYDTGTKSLESVLCCVKNMTVEQYEAYQEFVEVLGAENVHMLGYPMKGR